MSIDLREFSDQRLADVRDRWLAIAGEDEFQVELSPFFAWCATHVQPKTGDSHALELFNAKTGETDAIVEIVNAREGKLHKLLKLIVSPRLWDIDANRDEVVSLYASAFSSVIDNGIMEGVNDIKIYGRNDLMRSILRSLHAHWPQDGFGATVKFEGRWLTFTFN